MTDTPERGSRKMKELHADHAQSRSEAPLTEPRGRWQLRSAYYRNLLVSPIVCGGGSKLKCPTIDIALSARAIVITCFRC